MTFSSNRHPALFLLEHDLFVKTVFHFPDHALPAPPNPPESDVENPRHGPISRTRPNPGAVTKDLRPRVFELIEQRFAPVGIKWATTSSSTHRCGGRSFPPANQSCVRQHHPNQRARLLAVEASLAGGSSARRSLRSVRCGRRGLRPSMARAGGCHAGSAGNDPHGGSRARSRAHAPSSRRPDLGGREGGGFASSPQHLAQPLSRPVRAWQPPPPPAPRSRVRSRHTKGRRNCRTSRSRFAGANAGPRLRRG